MLRSARRFLVCALIALPLSVAPAWYGAITWTPKGHPAVTEDEWRLERPLVSRIAGETGERRARDEAGWPFRSLSCDYAGATSNGEPYFTGTTWGIALELPEPGGPISRLPAALYARAIPLRPIPLGFAANFTIVFAIGLALIAVPGATRRWRRRRDGRCPKCGYRLAGATRCPECGRAPHRR